MRASLLIKLIASLGTISAQGLLSLAENAECQLTGSNCLGPNDKPPVCPAGKTAVCCGVIGPLGNSGSCQRNAQLTPCSQKQPRYRPACCDTFTPGQTAARGRGANCAYIAGLLAPPAPTTTSTTTTASPSPTTPGEPTCDDGKTAFCCDPKFVDEDGHADGFSCSRDTGSCKARENAYCCNDYRAELGLITSCTQ